MGKKILGFGIIGCGYISAKHAEALSKCPNARLVSCFDVDQERALAFSNSWNCSVSSTLAELLSDADVEVVCICTPSGLHPEIIEEAAHMGKHIIVEKPLALTPEAARKAVNTCKIAGVNLEIVMPFRFSPLLRKTKELIEEGRLGKITHSALTIRLNRSESYYSSATWRGSRAMDGGCLMNQGIHGIDLLCWMLGRPESVFCKTRTAVHSIETDDVAVGVVKFESGELATFEVSTAIHRQNVGMGLSIFGDRGLVMIGGRAFDRVDEFRLDGTDDSCLREAVASGSHLDVIRDMMKTILDGSRLSMPGEEGLLSIDLISSAYESASLNTPMAVLRPDEGVA